MKTVGLGLIGCGVRGLSVASRTLEQSDHLRMVAVYDPDENAVDRIRASFGAETKVFTRESDIFAEPGIDWVMVASPNNEHRRQCVTALEAGKDVWCEKPLATTVEDCLAIAEAVGKSGRQFSMGFTLRYSPHYRKIKSLINEGTIGRVISFEFNETIDFNHGGYIMSGWRRFQELAGSHLLEKCCHDIDLANWMTSSLPRRVASFGGRDFYTPEFECRRQELKPGPKGERPYQSWERAPELSPFTAEKDIIDNQVAILEYQNGIRATFHANCNAAMLERRMYILGTHGTIRADVITGQIELKRIGFEEEVKDYSTGASGGHGNGDELLCQELADAMLVGKPPSVGIREGIESAVACFAIDQAMNEGNVVDLAPMWERTEKVL